MSHILSGVAVSLAIVLVSPMLLAELAGDAPVIPTPAPPRLPFEEEDRLAKGWIATFSSGDRSVDARRLRLAALHVAERESPTPFLPPGKFVVELTGYFYVELGGPVSIMLRGRGRATVSVNDVDILEGEGDLSAVSPGTVQLHTGYNPIRIAYQSPSDGDSTLQLRWAGPDFNGEPLQPAQLFHDPEHPALIAATRRRRGRELVGILNCKKCHTSSLPGDSADVMPELTRDNPRLIDVGSRLNAEWMFQWILDPKSLHNEATMPAVLTTDDMTKRKQQAADIAVFLANVHGNVSFSEQRVDNVKALVDQGELLFERRGCIGCHRFSPPDDEDYFDRISLHYTNSKFRDHALVDFLLQPHQHYAWNRMPDFQLNQQEATSLAAFVRSRSKARIEKSSLLAGARPEQGRQSFHEVGCANCHELGPTFGKPLKPIAWRDVANEVGGCLTAAAEDHDAAPDYAFSKEDREALVEFLREELASLRRVVPVEAAERFIHRLRCTVCHSRDGELNQLDDVIFEESVVGLPPEAVPHLTWVGEKLQRDWSERFMAGHVDYRPRPWLQVRMPAFPVHARLLAIGLEAQHGMPMGRDRLSPKAAAFDPSLALIGERLLRQPPSGFFCTECHAVGDQPPAGAFDHKGVNLAHAADRLHRDFYMRWITAPKRIDRGSRMPTLSPDGRTTQISDVLGGDAQKQFDALWNYLLSLQGSFTVDNTTHTSPARTEKVSIPQ